MVYLIQVGNDAYLKGERKMNITLNIFQGRSISQQIFITFSANDEEFLSDQDIDMRNMIAMAADEGYNYD